MLQLGSFWYNMMHMKIHVVINKGFITLKHQWNILFSFEELTQKIFGQSGKSFGNLFVRVNVLTKT